MAYEQITDACMAATIGDGGLTEEHLAGLAAELVSPVAELRKDYEESRLPLLRLPERTDDLEQLRPIADMYRERFTDVVILGTGGSSLGGRALYMMSDAAASDEESKLKGPALHIVTNIDPFTFDGLFRQLNPRTTGLIVISKSGGTAETVLQFLSVLPIFRDAVGEDGLKRRVVMITENTDNPLRRIAARFDLTCLDHDPNVGGRYSVLSIVGMLPAMIAGLPPEPVREGARAVLMDTLSSSSSIETAPIKGAAIAVGLNRYCGVHGSVMLAYSDRLGSVSRWYRQLWAESLGKNGMGTTPIYGTGPVDQHSQLQLWLDGPPDKMFTVLGGPLAAGGAPVDSDLADTAGINYAKDRTLGDLMEASRRATAATLAKHGRPVRLLNMQQINGESMGALMMHFMIETILSARIMGVDPFDQPAVEHGKKLARQYMADLSSDNQGS